MRDDIDSYPPFPGREQLLAALDHAVQLTGTEAVTLALQRVLREAITDARINLPSRYYRRN